VSRRVGSPAAEIFGVNAGLVASWIMSVVAINGTEIAYQDTGSGPVVVLSHGFLMDHAMFDPQLAALSAEFRVITWDQRGHGGSPASGPFSYWDSARDVLALLDHLGVQRAVLGGVSQGGFLSLRAALLAPERAQALVLIDTQSGTEDPALAGGYDQIYATWLRRGPATLQEIVSAIIIGPGQWPDWYAKWADLDHDQLTLSYRCLMDRDDITAKLGQITCPAIVIHGTADDAIPFAKAEALRDGLGGWVTLLPVEGAHHAANLTHPGQVNPPLLAFLRGLAER
jgi:3-oxoadipate enol-lactonase